VVNRLLLLPLLFSITCPAAWAQNSVGAEFGINTYTTNSQSLSAVASDENGNFVVVWRSVDQDGSGNGVFGQRFHASGLPLGSEFQVNSYTTSSQLFPAVASAANGTFVAVWQSYGQDGSFNGVFGQRFNASGGAQGANFRVNTYAAGNQLFPAVSSDVNGNFVVVWASNGQDGSLHGVFGQRFSAGGLPQGPEFQVNSYTTSYQSYPAVASAANGNFVVVWASFEQDGSQYGIFGQRFNAAGLPQGSEFRVNSYTTFHQYRPAVASAADGDFVVVWASNGQDGSGSGVFGQRFNASGAPQGSEIQANSYAAGNQRWPSVGSAANGNFVVTWASYGQDGSNSGIFGQRFHAFGLPLESEFQVSSYTTGYQIFPAVGSAANGNFVVVWQSYGQDGSSEGIFGQRYGDLIFLDGFE
jgi:hypothetical protein